MSKKMYGLNLDMDLKSRLDKMAIAKYTNTSNLANQIFAAAIDEWEDKVKEKKVIKERVVPQTEEARLAEWEWRKLMVAQGRFPVHMGDEYITEIEDLSKHVYLTPDDIDNSQE